MSNPLISKVEEKVKGNSVMIFMKGTPENPQCGFSAKACELLSAAGAEKLASVDVLSETSFREAVKEYTQWPTIPQIFIHGKFIGGSDIVTEMYESGELQKLLKGSKPR